MFTEEPNFYLLTPPAGMTKQRHNPTCHNITTSSWSTDGAFTQRGTISELLQYSKTLKPIYYSTCNVPEHFQPDHSQVQPLRILLMLIFNLFFKSATIMQHFHA